MVILTFDDNEDELLKRVLSIVEPVIPCIKDTEKGFWEFQGIKIGKLRRVVICGVWCKCGKNKQLLSLHGLRSCLLCK